MQGVASADYRAGEVLVKYKDDSFRVMDNTNRLYESVGVRDVGHYTGVLKNFEKLVLKKGISVEQAVADLEKSGMVEYAQPNYILSIPEKDMVKHANTGGKMPCIPGMEIPGCDKGGGGGGGYGAKPPCIFPGVPYPPGCQDTGNPGDPSQPPTDPSQPTPPATGRPTLGSAPAEVIPAQADPDLAKVYGMSKIQAVEAWKVFRGSKNFIVADIDTGIDYNHDDISFNVWRNAKPTRDDVVGFDFIHNDGLPFDDQGHGTHTAGTIGAVGGNGIGVSGVAQQISIMALKFLSAEGSGTTGDAIKAIDYAITHGAKVLSNSWGGKGDDGNKALSDAVERARAADVLFVAAAGNDGTDNDGSDPAYPAAFTNDNMLTVAATDDKDDLAFFSNYGKKTTHVAAPGVNVYSLAPGNKYATHSGTSMACPHVAGAAALIWSKKPSMTYKEVKDILMKTADSLPALQGKTVTGGRINVLRALRSME